MYMCVCIGLAKYGNTLFYIRLISIGLTFSMWTTSTVLCYGMQYPFIYTRLTYYYTRIAERIRSSAAHWFAKSNLPVKVLDVNCEGRLF